MKGKSVTLIVLSVFLALTICGAASANTSTTNDSTNISVNDTGNTSTSQEVSGQDCLPTVANGTINGEVYISSIANWPSESTTNTFTVPNGTVVYAKYYVGIWMPGTASSTFNGNTITSEASYSSGMGVTWISYDVTNKVIAGQTNTATSTSTGGDDRQYGCTLVVVLQNESDPSIAYWVADGLDWLRYAESGSGEVNWSNTTLAGAVNLSKVENASLYSVHLTGYNYEDLNGNTLPSAAESVSGDYFNAYRWDNLQNLLVSENQTVNVGRGDDAYCCSVFHALTITYQKMADLVPVSLTPNIVIPNTDNTITTTIKNQGNKDATTFNASLLVDGIVRATQSVSSLTSGNSTIIDFHWTPDGTKDSYTLTVSLDTENSVIEDDETNNILFSMVGTSTVLSPIANFTVTSTSGYVPLTVNFTDQSINSPTSWTWDFGDGTTSTEQNPTHTYATPGSYSVKLTVTNANGSDEEVKTSYITVNYPTPVANFTANTTSGVSPLNVKFTDTSAQIVPGTITGWAWDFNNDGVIDSIEENPSYTYTALGTYTVNLAVTGPSGSNTLTRNNYITVIPIVGTNLISGLYSTAQTIELTSDDPNATIYYTTDSSNPKTSATRIAYIEPITINSSTTLRYAACSSEGSWSPLYVQYYVIGTSNELANTSWPKFRANLNNTSQSVYNGPQTNNLLWTYTTGGVINSSPAIGADGTIYIGSADNNLYAFNPDGTLKWAYTTGGDIELSSPAIAADGTIYIGSGDNKLYAINPDGTLKWSYTAGGQLRYNSPAIGVDGTIYIGSEDNKLYAINPDGTLKWAYTTGRKIQYSTPAIGVDGTIYIGSSDKKLYAINPDGTLKWTYTAGNYVYDAPAIGSDGTIYIGGSYDAKIYAINSDGTLKWTYKTGNVIYSSPAIATDGTIYIGSADNNLYAFNPDGTVKWYYTAGNSVMASPSVAADGIIYIGCADGTFYAFNPDGTLKWTHTTGDYIWGSPAIGSDGTLYIGSRDGKLYAFQDAAPVADFSATTTNGIVPFTVTFIDESTGYATSYYWDFGDGTNSTEQNPTHTYNNLGTHTVKLTVSSSAGSDVEEKIGYITVCSSDLTVTGVNCQQSTVFAGESNNVTVTVVNDGTTTANGIVVNLYASDVDGGTTIVAFTTIDSLEAGASTTVTLVDPTIRPITADTVYGSSNVGYVTYTAVADPNNTIPETNETNNFLVSELRPVYYNGYKGKRYEYNGEDATSSDTNTAGDINTQHIYDLQGDVVYSSGTSSYHSVGWTNSTGTWTTSDISVPSTGTVVDALLYVSYNWDTTSDGDPNWTITFNGVGITPIAWYTDQKNFAGSWALYKYGLLVYNVTNLYSTGDNTLNITALTGNSNALYPSTLVVVYADANSKRKQIFINEQCDELLYGPSYGLTLDEVTAYAPFTGLTIDTSNVVKATLYSFTGSGGPYEGNFFWNGNLIKLNAWNGTDKTSSAEPFDVTSYLTSTGNVASLQGTSSGGMAALQQILVVEYAPDLVVTNVTVNKGVGDYWFANESNLINVTVVNQGGSPSPESTLSVDINGTTYTVTVPALAVGANATVTITDTTSRTAGDSVPVTPTTDPSDSIPETNEANNIYAVTFTVYNNGYKGKRYTDGNDLETSQTFEGNYEVIYSSGNSTYRSGGTGGSAWNNPYTVTWTSGDLMIPEGATVVQARLYQAYTWNTALGVPDFVASFNGNTLAYSAWYSDTKGYGTSNYPSGLLVYDVTSYFNSIGNTLTLNKGFNTTTSIYGSYLVVIYEDTNATYKMIYINDGTDLLYSYNPYSVNDIEATAYATFNNVDTTNMSNASVIVVMASADKSGQSKFFFNGNVYSGFWNDYTGNSGAQTGFSVYDVFGNILNGSNLVGIQSYNNDTTGDNMVALNSILVVTYDNKAPVVNASLGGGLFNTTQMVNLTATDDQDTSPAIYYTTNGTIPTMGSTLYTGPITISTTTVLSFVAVDDVGNISPVQSQTYTIDNTAPVVTVNPEEGIFNTSKSVTLTVTDNLDTHPDIYYTTDGTAPTTGSSVYTGPITVGTTTTLRFFAVDDAGNPSIVQTKTFTIDTVAPEVNADLDNGTFEIVKSVNLTATDNLDTNPTIYYTTDGTIPTTSSTQYTGPITVDKAMKLRFFAVDDAGNISPVGSRIYDVRSDVYVEVTASNDAPGVGDTVRYTFKLCNRGPGTATDVVFTYQIPEGMEYTGVSKDSGLVTYDPATRTITWTFSELVAGDPYLWLDLRVLNAGTYLIQPLVTISNYNPGLVSNIGSLEVKAVVKATSVQAASTTASSVQTGTVPMQTTGIPLGALLVGLLCIVSGLGLRRRF